MIGQHEAKPGKERQDSHTWGAIWGSLPVLLASLSASQIGCYLFFVSELGSPHWQPLTLPLQLQVPWGLFGHLQAFVQPVDAFVVLVAAFP